MVNHSTLCVEDLRDPPTGFVPIRVLTYRRTPIRLVQLAGFALPYDVDHCWLVDNNNVNFKAVRAAVYVQIDSMLYLDGVGAPQVAVKFIATRHGL